MVYPAMMMGLFPRAVVVSKQTEHVHRIAGIAHVCGSWYLNRLGSDFRHGYVVVTAYFSRVSLFQRYLVEGISHPLHKKSVQKALDGLRRYGRDA